MRLCADCQKQCDTFGCLSLTFLVRQTPQDLKIKPAKTRVDSGETLAFLQKKRKIRNGHWQKPLALESGSKSSTNF